MTGPRLSRTTFRTSRLLDFFSEKELVAQIGHPKEQWPLVVLKELMDNALDACEEGGVAPEVRVTLDPRGIALGDNGRGLPAETVESILDFRVRVSAREAYVSPTRGAQGNALKTLVAMPYVLGGGSVEIASGGRRHAITVEVDQIRQEPIIHHAVRDGRVKSGTEVRLYWPDLASSLLTDARDRFLQMAEACTWLNPHLALTLSLLGERIHFPATAPAWRKWGPSDPTSPHWYRAEHLGRLMAAYLAHDADGGREERTVRQFISEFRGLSGTAKQRAVLEATGLARAKLSALRRNGHELDGQAVAGLLAALQKYSAPVKPAGLGVIGRDHLAARFESLGCNMKTFQYTRKADVSEDGLPWVLESAFGWCEKLEQRRLIIGVNWSPGIVNPFRELGPGQSLDTILERQRVGRDEPVVLFLHLAQPRVQYADRGKSGVVVAGDTGDDGGN
jgi:DNA topoisomerase VI subunit B